MRDYEYGQAGLARADAAINKLADRANAAEAKLARIKAWADTLKMPRLPGGSEHFRSGYEYGYDDAKTAVVGILEAES